MTWPPVPPGPCPCDGCTPPPEAAKPKVHRCTSENPCSYCKPVTHNPSWLSRLLGTKGTT